MPYINIHISYTRMQHKNSKVIFRFVARHSFSETVGRPQDRIIDAITAGNMPTDKSDLMHIT